MEHHKQIRRKLIQSCLCDSSGHSHHVDLMGVCGFYILTDSVPLLKYYSMHTVLADWLFSERIFALTGDLKKAPKMFNDTGNNVNENMKLYAMVTNPDGNCLLHAISICLWGVEDKSNSEVSLMRSALRNFMESNKSSLLIHYKSAEKRFDNQCLGGIDTPESEYLKQMDQEITRLDDNKKYLSSLHVFCMANMLRRPIIVYARPNPNGIMRGIYLPTLYRAGDCYQCPITLVWMDNHFTAVLSSELSSEIFVPLFDSAGPLDFPYGWIGKDTPEYLEAKAKGVPNVITGLGFFPELSVKAAAAARRPAATPPPPYTGLDFINPLRWVSSLTCFFLPSEDGHEEPPNGHFHDLGESAHDVTRRYLRYHLAHSGNGRMVFPYAERVSEHPARERLLGESWRDFSTVWVGRFKDIAFENLCDAVTCLCVDVYGEGIRGDVSDMLKDLLSIHKDGVITDCRLRYLLTLLIATGDCRSVQDTIFTKLDDNVADIQVDPHLIIDRSPHR